MKIASNSGNYRVHFNSLKINQIWGLVNDNDFIFMDRHVANLYKNDLTGLLNHKNLYLIDPLETSKSFEAFGKIYEFLLENSIRKNSRILAVGGGITQDITCFISSTIYRGVEWIFIPTTLLSQCDSCIGSKSSVNLYQYKNAIGNFYPPKNIYIIPEFLMTLPDLEIRSGIGEMFKVSMIDGLEPFFKFAEKYEVLIKNRDLLPEYIKYALSVKKVYVEIDEFDRGIRNIFNYGHSFGHAIESATSFAIPHGIAVTIGMDIANFIAYSTGSLNQALLNQIHTFLCKNYQDYKDGMPSAVEIIDALKSDKKNTFSNFTFILIGPAHKLSKQEVKNDAIFFKNLTLALEFICHE